MIGSNISSLQEGHGFESVSNNLCGAVSEFCWVLWLPQSNNNKNKVLVVRSIGESKFPSGVTLSVNSCLTPCVSASIVHSLHRLSPYGSCDML